MGKKKSESVSVKVDSSDIETRLTRLEKLLQQPGTRPIEIAIEHIEESESITGAIRQAILEEKSAGRSLASIAEDAGLSRAHVHNFSHGKKDLNGASLDKLAKVLGLKVMKK